MLQYHGALESIQDESLDVSDETHMDDKTLATSRIANTVLFLGADQHYLMNPDKPKADFQVHDF